MFTVQPLCKVLTIMVSIYIILLINIAGQDSILRIISIIFIVWLYRYLASLKIYINDSYLIKQNGKTFKHKTVLMLKNISRLETLILHPSLPAVIRIRTYDRSVFVLGLNGRQRTAIENFICRLKWQSICIIIM